MGLLSTIGAASGRAFGLTRVGAVIRDAYFNLVTLLLPGNGTNGAQNNTFLDSSTNNFTITRNGNTTQGSFSPFSQTGWSNWLPTSGNENIAVTTANSAFALGTGDFTIEGWFYLTNPTYAQGLCHINTAVNATVNGYAFGITSAGLLQFYANATFTNTNVTLAANTWYHIALVKSSGTVKIYVNGTNPTSGGSSADSQNLGNSVCYVGLFYNTSGYTMTGYASNFRVVKGTAVYTANFTSPTTPLTAITNTSFLTCQSNRFVDNSSNALSLTLTGSPSVQAFSPFAPTAAYDAAVVGASGYFDGTGDWLQTPSNAAFSPGTGDFTIECWAYLTAVTGEGTLFYVSATNGINLFLNISSNWGIARAGVAVDNNFGTPPTFNVWNHLAVSRSGTTIRAFINGVQVFSGSNSSNYAQGAALIGSSNSFGTVTGYISNFRFLKGTALYTSAFTPPTAPLTSITNTSLLLNFTNAAITDATAKNDLETVGNAQISTTQSKFGGSSMYFDGTGDYLLLPERLNFDFGTGDFTIECWIYLAATPSTSNIIIDTRISDTLTAWSFSVSGTSKLDMIYGTSRVTSTGSISTGTWTHVAATRSGSSIRLFINGTQDGSATSSSAINSANNPAIGGGRSTAGSGITGYYLNGYIDDLRITKGYARYTGNFTPPTAAYALQ